ncbi:hypothetical protein BABINDRAFT_168591 [Babjeviella inositovora NRRL Y-12698]|uniref:DnaJ homologue subfamily C member 28 conserved domain-containing protein n=1 Tax=Babjeviella inositovora NRRL Y-12698 TaxID=984486 RepID=A0A1E3QK00_9ASCO|nr:uncharacterized protein BABINDRAFT_168591 [Babjeviella inositovora NRRL Y-12698]ODQ78013.1 hypothetical protein BABINDRAFT_168591 [Babjeviella inositovora NRRL Y-12698]
MLKQRLGHLHTASLARNRSAIHDRMRQMAEDAISEMPPTHPERQKLLQMLTDEPSGLEALKARVEKSILDETRLSRLPPSDLDAKAYNLQYQRELSLTKLPASADKTIRETAMATPWTGEEHLHDTALRMLQDAHKPVKVRANTNPHAPNLNKIITPPVPLKQRIAEARDKSLDYLLNKGTSFEEDPKFREMYRERLLGPEILGPISAGATINAIHRIADARIEESQSRGDFSHNSLRGKPMPKTHSSAYINTTEYYMNNILKLQDVSPPWVEKQGSVNEEIARFRRELDDGCARAMIQEVDRRYPKMDLPGRLKQIEAQTFSYGNWEASQRAYIESKVSALNNSLRSYNLQAPMALQKLYLLRDKEVEQCYARVKDKLAELYHKHHERNAGESNIKVKGTSFTSQQYEVRQVTPTQQEVEGLGSMLRGLFRRK